MLFGYNYYEFLAYIDASGDTAVEEEDEYMAVFNVAFKLRLVDQQEVKYNDTANNKNMRMSLRKLSSERRWVFPPPRLALH